MNYVFFLSSNNGISVFEITSEDPLLVAKVCAFVGKIGEPGTIRGDFGTSMMHNAVHASDSNESAIREIKIWQSQFNDFNCFLMFYRVSGVPRK